LDLNLKNLNPFISGKMTSQKISRYTTSKQTLALRQGSEESACFLLSFLCDD